MTSQRVLYTEKYVKVGRVEQSSKECTKNPVVESTKKLWPKGNSPKYSTNSKFGGDMKRNEWILAQTHLQANFKSSVAFSP